MNHKIELFHNQTPKVHIHCTHFNYIVQTNEMAPTLTKVVAIAAYILTVAAQRPPNGPGGGGGGGGGGIQCPTDTQFTGSPNYTNTNTPSTPMAAPLRGNVGCIDLPVLATRPTVLLGGRANTAQNIFGPMEAGFTSSNPGTSCLSSNVIPGGIDTNLAEHMIEYFCPDAIVEVLDSCGGHAVPYHYHERMSCLFTNDEDSGHSTRIGTALDGNGIYGNHIDGGVTPTDLDACGGRTGVTPDSNGVEVYYYSVSAAAPFSVGCFGPVSSVEECRALYDTCDGVRECVTTVEGTGWYDLDCPCFDGDESNVVGQGVPGYLQGGVSLGDDCQGGPTESPTDPGRCEDDNKIKFIVGEKKKKCKKLKVSQCDEEYETNSGSEEKPKDFCFKLCDPNCLDPVDPCVEDTKKKYEFKVDGKTKKLNCKKIKNKKLCGTNLKNKDTLGKDVCPKSCKVENCE